jgi:hypothetical protein
MMQYLQRARHRCLAAVAIAACALTIAAPVLASRIVQAQVTGHVTAILGDASISVDGKEYLIAAGSAAFHSIQSVHVGDQVSLIMDGPPTSSSSHVTVILPGPSEQ